MKVSRRGLIAATGAVGAATLLSATATATASAAPASGPVALTLDDPALLQAFVKARSSLDNRLTIGWMDAVTYAFIDGATYPLYRLLAATWQSHQRVSPIRFEGRSLEIAHFLDLGATELLASLTMPVTGKVIDVPRYRAGPSEVALVVHDDSRSEFRMQGETRDGASFFRTGTSERRQGLSEPQRDGADFLIRQDLDTRVLPEGASRPSFFYREWTITRAPWAAIADDAVLSADCEVLYSAIAAFRPWMQMDGISGHTLQNGRGGKVQDAARLPPKLLELTTRIYPDLLKDPRAALAYEG